MEAEDLNNQHRHGEDERVQLPQGFMTDLAKRFADYLVSLPDSTIQEIINLLIVRMESAPSFISFFMICLICSAERLGDYELYWKVWRLLSNKAQEIAIKLSDRNIRYDDLSRLIRGLLFGDIARNQVKPEESIIKPGVDAVLAFVNNAGENPIVFEAMSCLLFYYPNLFMPKGFLILAIHQKRVGGTHLLGGVNTVFYLERVLQQLLVLRPSQHGFSKELRDASLILLNTMIETGSSSAYFLRDYLLHTGCNK